MDAKRPASAISRFVDHATDAPSGAAADSGMGRRVEAPPLPVRIRLMIGLIALFVATGWVAKQLAIPPANVTMLWLPSGVAVGALLMHGRWLWPGILIGSVTLNIVLGLAMGSTLARSGPLALCTATGATLQALLAVTLLQRRFGDRLELSNPRAVAVAVVVLAVLPALLAASLGHVALVALRGFPLAQVPGNLATWALGDMLGILTVAPFAMIGEHRRFRALWHDAPIRGLYGFIALGCGLALALTLFAWVNARARVIDSGRASFAVLTAENEQALRARLSRAAQGLDAASGLFTAGERVTWAEWVAYAKVIDLQRAFPGIQEVSFIRRVPRNSVPAFLAETARNGLPIRSIRHAPPEGGDHYVLTYSYPLPADPLAMGVDMRFERNRRDAADQARDTGMAVVTRPIRFVVYRGPGYGFAMMRPVYASPDPPRTVAERRRTLIGWVSHPFTAQRFFGDLTAAQGRDLELRIRAQQADGSWATVFDSAPGSDRTSSFTARRQLDAAGRLWLLEWRSTAAFEQKVRSFEPLLVLLTGLTISLALAILLGMVARRTAVVSREVERATAELSEANRLLLMTEATNHVGHWRYDLPAGSLFWSDEVYRIHGRDRSRPITRDESLAYIHAEDRDRVWQAMLAAVRDQGSFKLGLRIRREDGEIRHLSYLGRVESNAAGRPVALLGVIQDVTDEALVRDRLLKARDSARREAAARGQFLASLSHEIRTPMNGVIGFGELLLQTDLTADQQNYAQIIVESGATMMALLNDVLDLSKIEAGHVELADEPLMLEELAYATIRTLMPSVRQRDLWLEVQIDPALPARVRGDPLRLRQVLLNLLSNAIKFTDQGFVRLEISRMETMIRFAVVDSGAGIPPERLDDIFQSFVQLDSPGPPVGTGTGLGLAISSSLVAMMGGKLKVNSRLGEGSTFHFTLPCRPADEAAASEAGEPAVPILGEPVAPVRARVLLAEDHDINQALIRATAERLGLELDVADHGGEAIARVEAAEAAGTPYDLVLMDIQMPVVDGIEATHRLRAMGYDPDRLPIVALSANVYQSDIDACLAAGMQAHLAKPVRREELERAIATWARRAPHPASAGPVPLGPAPANTAQPTLLARYQARRDALAETLDRFDLAAATDPQTMAALIADIHKFAGTAGHFGDEASGEVARTTERALIDALPQQRINLARSLRDAIKSDSGGSSI